MLELRHRLDLPLEAGDRLFAPDQIVKRRQDWGPGGVESRFAEAWEAFLPLIADRIRVVERSGADGIEQTYLEVLDGEADPADAFVLTP